MTEMREPRHRHSIDWINLQSINQHINHSHTYKYNAINGKRIGGVYGDHYAGCSWCVKQFSFQCILLNVLSRLASLILTLKYLTKTAGKVKSRNNLLKKTRRVHSGCKCELAMPALALCQPWPSVNRLV